MASTIAIGPRRVNEQCRQVVDVRELCEVDDVANIVAPRAADPQLHSSSETADGFCENASRPVNSTDSGVAFAAPPVGCKDEKAEDRAAGSGKSLA
jgi:hypothetical protein